MRIVMIFRYYQRQQQIQVNMLHRPLILMHQHLLFHFLRPIITNKHELITRMPTPKMLVQLVITILNPVCHQVVPRRFDLPVHYLHRSCPQFHRPIYYLLIRPLMNKIHIVVGVQSK